MDVIFCLPVDIVGRGRDKCSPPAINENSKFTEIFSNRRLEIQHYQRLRYMLYSKTIGEIPSHECHLRTKTPAKVGCSTEVVEAKSGFVTWSASLLRPVGTGYLRSFRCPLKTRSAVFMERCVFDALHSSHHRWRAWVSDRGERLKPPMARDAYHTKEP